MTLQARLAAASAPGDVLIWWGSSDLPTGQGEAPVLSQLAFEGAYLRLENGARTPGAVRPLPAVLAAVDAFRPDGPLPIAIAHFTYGVTAPDPAADAPLTVETREAFFACGLLHDQWGLAPPAYRGRSVPLLVSEEFLLGGPAPDRIELDPGDGFREVQLGTPLVAEPSAASIGVRCTYGSDVRTAAFTLPLSDAPAAPRPDETWPLQGENGNHGTAWVYRAHGAAAVTRPFVMVEGFPGGHPADYLYDVVDQQGTATALRAAGRDIVIVGLDQGMDTVQRNADVLIACIRELKARTPEPLVVAGMSMGGLIARYALVAMEARGEPHQAEIFLTVDTPHAGTYTSLGAQWFVHTCLPYLPALAGYAALLDSPANQQFDFWWVHDGAVQTSPVREALVKDLAALGDYPQQPRKLAVASGRGDGARGAAAGARTLTWSGAPWIGLQVQALTGSGRTTVGQGTWLSTPLPTLTHDSDVAWEAAPGGQEPYNGHVAAIAAGVGCGTVEHAFDSTCTVPTVSALDLHDQDPFTPVPPPGPGASPFDDYAFAATDQAHLTITPEVSAWLLGCLGATPVPAGEIDA